ncbi:MAG TPA: glycosyltransferase [Polyangiaceae bacterium]|nr:glycosyltransferase [Polyangiaceae bacterium]
MSAARPIGLLIGDYLRPSETFIHDQLQHARRTEPFVCARRELAGARLAFPHERVQTLPRWEELFFKATRRSPTFLRYLRQHRVELLHAHFGLNGAHALELVDTLGVPLVVTFHGHDVAGLLPKNRMKMRYFQYQLLRDRLFERASLLLAASHDLARRLVELHGAPAEKVLVQALGVETDRFVPQQRDPASQIVLSVGRLVEKKGIEYGLAAFARARAEAPGATYRIVGEGPLRPALERRAEELGVRQFVEFLGARSHEQVRREMERADVLLLPSVTARDGDLESGVIVAKEAAATGLPVLGTIHGGIPEIIEDGETGFLAPERDVARLAERLEALLCDGPLRQRFGLASRRRVEREFDSVRQNELLESRLLDVLAGRRAT